MYTYVFAIKPEKRLFDNILDIKRKAKNLVGKQTYLEDEPHITLYVTELKSEDLWLGLLKKGISNNLNNSLFAINGWHVFKSDAITGLDTLVCKISEQGFGWLKEIQITLVHALAKYRTDSVTERYKNTYDSLPTQFRKSLKQYGYPFVGDIWKPHISIASFEKEALKKVWPAVKKLCPNGEYYPDTLVVYKLSANEKLNKLGEILFH